MPASTIHSLPRTLQHSSISAKRTCQLYKMQHFYVNFTFLFDLVHNFFIKTNKKNVFFARKRDDRDAKFHQNLSASLKSRFMSTTTHLSLKFSQLPQ